MTNYVEGSFSIPIIIIAHYFVNSIKVIYFCFVHLVYFMLDKGKMQRYILCEG